VIITKKEPFTQGEIQKLKEELDPYIKTVIDVENRICSAGANRHFENEEILLKMGSIQSNLWGGGIDLKTLAIDNNSMINIRPKDNNLSNEIQDPDKRKSFEDLMKYFFKIIYQQVASE